MKPKGLGRRWAPDNRDASYPIEGIGSARLAAEAEARSYRYWFDNGWWGDQGTKPHCVAYAALHWLEDGPVTFPERGPELQPGRIYRQAQRRDEWEGSDYDGTSVRAGMRLLRAQGFIREYRWAWNVDRLVSTLLEAGPVVLGTNWYSNMDQPDGEGRVQVGGSFRGGHAYVVNGINLDREEVRCKNSWGRGWAAEGRFWLSLADVDRLMREDGEICFPVPA